MVVVHALAAIYVLTALGVAGVVVSHFRYERQVEQRRAREDREVELLDSWWSLG